MKNIDKYSFAEGLESMRKQIKLTWEIIDDSKVLKSEKKKLKIFKDTMLSL